MRGASRWGIPAVLAGYFVVSALAMGPVGYAPVDLALLTVTYSLLALVLHRWSALLTGVARPLGLLAALGVGAMLVWHFRELAGGRLLRPISFAAWSAALGSGYFFFLVRRRDAGRRGRLAFECVAWTVLFAGAVGGFFHASNSFRWHLLRHNRLVGTPAYYVLARDVVSVTEGLWNGRESPVIPPRGAAVPGVRGGASRPNVVFVLVDTLRADALTAYGGAPDLMPRLNALAERSLVFRDVLANASWTRPSVASLFTGLLPEEHGAVAREYGLADEHRTLAEVLAQAGYDTAAFVANFAVVGRDAGFDQGFQEFHELDGGPGSYARAEHVNRAVKDWLSRYRPGPDGERRPTFLYIHYLDPHFPYLSGGGTTAVGQYRAELRYLDREMGRMLDALLERLAGPTWVLVTSDHGEEFGEHGESGHGHSLYGELIHLPVVVHSTRGGSAAEIEERLEARDLFDLLLGLARDDPVDVRGWAARAARPRRYASSYATMNSRPHRPYLGQVCLRGVEEEGLALIWSGYGPTYELYDLRSDPAQKRNLAGDRPDRIAPLLRSMEDSVVGWAERSPVLYSERTAELLRALGYVE